jgi:hypothetical protein
VKLYEVHVEFTYYAVADDARDAEWMAKDAFNDEDYAAISDAREVTTKTVPEWSGDCLVYGPDEDTTLDQALCATGLPNVASLKAAWRERLAGASSRASNAEGSRAASATTQINASNQEGGPVDHLVGCEPSTARIK